MDSIHCKIEYLSLIIIKDAGVDLGSIINDFPFFD